MAPAWRSDALLLHAALDELSAGLRARHGDDPRRLARAHAAAGRAGEVAARPPGTERAVSRRHQCVTARALRGRWRHC